MSQEHNIKRNARGGNSKKNNQNCFKCGLPGHFSRDCTSGGSRKPQETSIKPSPHQIEENQYKTLSNTFNSAELSYGGSDKIVFTPPGDGLKGAWKRFVKKELTHQHKMRHFITSCLIAADKPTSYEVEELVTELGQSEAKNLWQNSLQQEIGCTYNEPLASNVVLRKYFFTVLDKEMNSMNKMLNYSQRNLSSQKINTISPINPNKPVTYYGKMAKKVALLINYDPPGELSENGPRHDNDFSEISKISIIPTKNEVLCDRDPFLPTTNMDDTLHHLPKEHGGKHKYDDKGDMDGGDLNVYANVHFSEINVDLRRGFSCRMGFTQPKMRRNLDSKQALVDINFIDSLVYQIALKEIKKQNSGNSNEQTTGCFMVESIGTSYFHILKALQTTLPSDLPFEKYLAPQIIESSSFAAVDPPTYARAPEFEFDLSVLLENKNKRLLLNVADTSSHETVIQKLQESSSRSKSETIMNFSIEKLCPNIAASKAQGYELYQQYDELKQIQKDTKKILNAFSHRWLDWDNISSYLVSEYLDHWNMFQNPDIPSFLLETNDNKTEWQLVNNKKQQVNNKNKRSNFCQWICGSDLDLAQKWTDNLQIQEIEHNVTNGSNTFELLRYLDREEGPSTENNTDIENTENTENPNENIENPNENIENPNENPENTNDSYISYIQNWLLSWVKPEGDRPLEYLKTDPNVWQMSMAERIKLHDFWKENIQLDCLGELSRIKEQHEKKKNEIDKIYNENRRRFLLNCDVIGMTTNGAAKFQTLISSIEAGEVLEAHILSALTSKTQHMILIGDHNQAMRLEKSQLHTQRRMRGEISDLIRYTLYNDLVDEEKVVNYPNVRGAQKNVYFVDHRYSEDSGDNEFAMNSHSNTYEAKMIVEIVKYFVRNGYDKPGQIAVLTPYLGQLIKIRDVLSKSFVVVIDERDDQLITDMEESIDDENKNPDGEPVYSTIGATASRKKLHSDFWRKVLEILRKRGQVGPGFPIVCARHPDYKNTIYEAEQFNDVSPNDDPQHIGVVCQKPCTRLFPDCQHPCRNKICGENCGNCLWPIENITLPCGHEYKNAKVCEYTV
ncbi:15643_t:CDS:10 [Racocetra fulgida]|uniref:15643_t:CDS:1 n=1 Tax=Racocetra fulgida TaxID=60492 RepID=A0A9N8W5T9_9GLOM|nr:15643_t:CDS:10 [Racocetra fulgida]